MKDNTMKAMTPYLFLMVTAGKLSHFIKAVLVVTWIS